MSFDFDTIHPRLGTGSTKWSRYPEDVLPMWIADMDIAAPPAILKALHARLDQQMLGYSVARPEVREAIIRDLWDKYAWRVQPDELLFLPGVEPGFNMALHAFVQPGQSVVLQTPNYAPLRHAAGNWNLPKIEVPFELNDQGEYLTPLPALRQALKGAGALLLSNPHNPLGKVFPREELLAVANACLDQGTLIISDEIHAELCFDGRRHIPTASLSAEIARRTITLMSASKAYNVAGLKTCFAIVQDPLIRERFNKARCGMVDSVSPLGLEAGVVMHAPQGTYLAWLDCSALGLDDPQRFFLEQAKVGLSAGVEFGDDSQQFVRLNFGCPRALLEEGISRLERALKTL